MFSILLTSVLTYSIGVIIANVVFDVYERELYVCFNGSHIYVVQDKSPFIMVYNVDGNLISRPYIGKTPLTCAAYGSYLYVFTGDGRLAAYDHTLTKVAEVEVGDEEATLDIYRDGVTYVEVLQATAIVGASLAALYYLEKRLQKRR